MKRLAALTLSLTLLLGLAIPASGEEGTVPPNDSDYEEETVLPDAEEKEEIHSFPDIEGHWAQDIIEKWHSFGVIAGDTATGTFRPDDFLSRAEFATLLNRIMGYPLVEISAAAHKGTRELVQKTAQLLQELPPVAVYEPTYVERPPEVDTEGEVNIEEFDGTWVVDAPWLQRLIANVNFGDYESRNWFDQKLRQSGLFDKLEALGIKDGDIVSMYDLEFEYQR